MKLSSVTRINLTIVAVCISALLLVSVLGILPDDRAVLSQQRSQLSETLAMGLTHLVAKQEYSQANAHLALFAKRNPQVISIGLRNQDAKLLAWFGDHQTAWQAGQSNASDGCYVVPVFSDQGTWGSVEIRFTPLYAGIGWLISPTLLKLAVALASLIGFATWLHLNRILKYLDPNRVVPPRVRQTLDNFTEGVVLLDARGQIVLVNAAFSQSVGQTSTSLLGKSLNDFNWGSRDTGTPTVFPWQVTKEHYEFVNGATVSLVGENGVLTAVFSVNSTPVLDDQEKYQGAMVVFADVTPLDRKREELANALEELSQSQEEISKQNEELRFLATRDPLTSCINRRTFFEQFEKFWTKADASGAALCAMMVDIDFFKSINDNYGHGKGDQVLRETGALLNRLARPNDLVCRYGGEEFSILMPGLNLEEATNLAETIRQELAKMDFIEFSITASLGVSAHGLGATDPAGLLEQADKCLYFAKRNGRNQVVRFDQVPTDMVIDESKISRTKPQEIAAVANSIPYSAVSALLSALSYRDGQTGSHSARVANIAAQLAQEFLQLREVYVIEIASLLHDIGKVGVPDAILLKPGRLSKEEWTIMQRHDLIGVEIIRKSFQHPDLTKIVRYHRCHWDGSKVFEEQQPQGEDIPIGARILAIADAFDAMISDRPYRKGMSPTEAVFEIRRCAGTQFDPDLAERFCELVETSRLQLPKQSLGLSQELILGIGEQIEGLLEAIDTGNREAILALADRLRQTAECSHSTKLAEAMSNMVTLTNEDAAIERIAHESLELLNICRAMHQGFAEVDEIWPQSKLAENAFS